MKRPTATSARSLPIRSTATFVLALFLGGCAHIAADRGDASVPPAQKAAAAVPVHLPPVVVAGTASAVQLDAANFDWRGVVADEQLRELIELGLTHNRDLRIAALNIDVARARYRISEANTLPSVNGSAGGSASRSSADLNNGNTRTSHQLNVGLGVTAWELDLWGRLGRLEDSARASFLASEHASVSVRASLVTELARAWLALGADRQQEALARQTLRSREESLLLIEKRHALGAAAALDVAAARVSVETARDDLASAGTRVSQDLNALRLLLGTEPPERLLPVANALSPGWGAAASLVAVPENLPSTVLLRRPDVRAAEQNLLAARANLGAARAAMFPTLSLTAAAGTASTALSGLFGSGNGTWNFAPTLRLPIFDGGALRAGVEAAQAGEQQQLATYEKTVQVAFREVADALAERANLSDRVAAQERLVQAQEEAVRLATVRYRAGAESPLTLQAAERALWTAQQNLIALRLSEQVNRLALFKALGGA